MDYRIGWPGELVRRASSDDAKPESPVLDPFLIGSFVFEVSAVLTLFFFEGYYVAGFSDVVCGSELAARQSLSKASWTRVSPDSA